MARRLYFTTVDRELHAAVVATAQARGHPMAVLVRAWATEGARLRLGLLPPPIVDRFDWYWRDDPEHHARVVAAIRAAGGTVQGVVSFFGARYVLEPWGWTDRLLARHRTTH